MNNHQCQKICKRIDENRISIENPENVPLTLFANKDIPVEPEAVEQVLQFISIQKTANELWDLEGAGKIPPFWGEASGQIRQAILTPDFHFGGGIPVGTVAETQNFVIPQAVGNDVCCGMRLLVTDINPDELAPHLDKLEAALRAIFFQGQRDIPMSPRQREALLRSGLRGMLETHKENENSGLWAYYDARAQESDLLKAHFQGALETKNTFSYQGFITGSGRSDGRDSQIGSLGGGNHFVEIQTVQEIFDGPTSHAWGVKKNKLAIMIHTGSVELGHAVGGHFLNAAKGIFPKSIKHPEHGFYAIPTTGPHAKLSAQYMDAMKNAANFAFGNRLILGLMAIRALTTVLGRKIEAQLVYDAPHNLVWEGKDNGFLHRKGACPAIGIDGSLHNSFQFTGHPVIIPGSMGASSYLLAGEGNADALCSACHGAGRAVSRSKARHVDEETYRRCFNQLRVVTPIDPNAPEVRFRHDILQEYHARLKEEAPYSYKDITPVIQTVEDSHIAKRVARLWPILTVKG